MTKKELRQYASLYGFEITLKSILDMGFKTVSTTKKSIPTLGSQCNHLSLIDWDGYKIKRAKVNKVILHKDESITVMLENYNNLRFWK